MSSQRTKPILRESRLQTGAAVLLTIVALVYLVYRNSIDFIPPPETPTSQQDDPATRSASSLSTSSSSPAQRKVSGSDSQRANQQPDFRPAAGGALATDNDRSVKDSAARRSESSVANPGEPKSRGQTPRGPPWAAGISADVFEFLEQTDRELYQSPAGLVYGPGSVHDHRLAHVLEHARDDRGKPIHGVFDGRDIEILQRIDEAYLRIVNQHSGVTVSDTGRRKAYAVVFESRIGYVGGQAGQRQNQPAARTLVLVLEGNRVVTAYPKRN